MTSRSNREAQRLTLSWLDDLGVRERDLQERGVWRPVAVKASTPASEPPAPARSTVGDEHFRAMIRKNRGDLLFDWATKQSFPQMRVQLSGGRIHMIVSGIAAWRVTCQQCALEIVEAALLQAQTFTEEFPPMTDGERSQRMQMLLLAQWRDWSRFVFMPSGSRCEIVLGGSEVEWKRYAHSGIYSYIVEACWALEQDWNKNLLSWGESRGFPELMYCLADGGDGKIPAGAENWRVFLEETDDQDRVQMAMEATDLDELEAGREE